MLIYGMQYRRLFASCRVLLPTLLLKYSSLGSFPMFSFVSLQMFRQPVLGEQCILEVRSLNATRWRRHSVHLDLTEEVNSLHLGPACCCHMSPGLTLRSAEQFQVEEQHLSAGAAVPPSPQGLNSRAPHGCLQLQIVPYPTNPMCFPNSCLLQ